jgi:acyl dehydratase
VGVTAPGLLFEDVVISGQLPELSYGVITPVHLMRWSAAIENWHRIHYDAEFAVNHDGLPERLINGTFKQHMLTSLVWNWIGSQSWLWKITYRFKGMDVVGDHLAAEGSVIGTERASDYGLVMIEIGIRNARTSEMTTTGQAVAAVRYRSGPPVPYPFVPPGAVAGGTADGPAGRAVEDQPS